MLIDGRPLPGAKQGEVDLSKIGEINKGFDIMTSAVPFDELDGFDIKEHEGTLNTSEAEIVANISWSIRQQYPQVEPCPTQEDMVVAIVGGGPSLASSMPVLKARWKEGDFKVVSLNGTHDYLIKHGVEPSAHIQLDARPHNARFVANPIEKCKYLMASQCAPEVFRNLRGHEVYLWHSFNTRSDKKVLVDYYFGRLFPIVGGSTVMLRSFHLLRMLGFPKFEIFGFDSCYMGNEHHSYPQEENNYNRRNCIQVKVGDRIFVCDGWMLSQAKEFLDLTRKIGDHWELVVHGNGLISHIIQTGATKLEEVS